MASKDLQGQATKWGSDCCEGKEVIFTSLVVQFLSDLN